MAGSEPSYAPGCEMDDESRREDRQPRPRTPRDVSVGIFERGRAPLDELLEPEVLQGVREAVDEHQRHVEAMPGAQDRRTRTCETDPRERERDEREQRAVQAVVVAQMHGGQRRVAGLRPRDLAAHEDRAAEPGHRRDRSRSRRRTRGGRRRARSPPRRGERRPSRPRTAATVADRRPGEGQDGEPDRDQRRRAAASALAGLRPGRPARRRRGQTTVTQRIAATTATTDTTSSAAGRRRRRGSRWPRAPWGSSGRRPRARRPPSKPPSAHVVELVERQARVGDRRIRRGRRRPQRPVQHCNDLPGGRGRGAVSACNAPYTSRASSVRMLRVL